MQFGRKFSGIAQRRQGSRVVVRFASRLAQQEQQPAARRIVRLGALLQRVKCGLEELHRILECQQRIGSLTGARGVVDGPVDITGGKEVARQLRQHGIDIGAARYLHRIADDAMHQSPPCRT